MSDTARNTDPHDLREPSGSGGFSFPQFGGVTSHLSTWVGILSAVIGGYMALDTYRKDVAKSVDQRVEKTFEMVARFNAAELAAARANVISYVEAKRFCDARYISRDLTDADFIAAVNFFDLAHACVEADLCDAATADRFFGPYANFQWPIVEKIVEEIRAEPQSMRADAGFGEGMKAFAANPTPAPPCDGNF